MKRLFSISVRGKQHEWSFSFRADERYLAGWRADGLVIHEIINQVPQIVADLGFTRIWIWLQDHWLIPL